MKVIFQVLLDDPWEKTNQIDSKVSKQISFVGAIRGVIEVCHMHAMHMYAHFMHIIDVCIYGPHIPYAICLLIQFSKLKFNSPKLKALRRKDGGLFYTNMYKEKLIDEINKSVKW
jgi:hypothetical protein